MFRNLFLLCLCTGLWLSDVAGQSTYRWRLRLGGGVMAYYGDLSYRWQDDWRSYLDMPEQALPWATSLSLERRLSSTFALALSGQYGYLTANDRLTDGQGNLVTDNPNFERALNFRSEMAGAQLMLHIRLDNGWLLPRRSRIAPYLFVGAGMSAWQVYGDLFRDEGQRYYYWQDGRIRDRSELTTPPDQANVITQDGDFETRLDNLRTEAEGDYESLTWHIPAGLGVDVRLTERLRLGLMAQVNYVNSDYLDDVSGAYRQDFSGDNADLAAYASNPSSQTLPADLQRGDDQPNDWYGLLNLTLSYDFGVKFRNYQPTYFYATESDPMLLQPEAVDTALVPNLAADSLGTDSLAATLPTPSLAAVPTDSSATGAASDSTALGNPLAMLRPDTVQGGVVYQTNNYYFYDRGRTPAATLPDTSLRQELSALRAEVADLRDSLARLTVVPDTQQVVVVQQAAPDTQTVVAADPPDSTQATPAREPDTAATTATVDRAPAASAQVAQDSSERARAAALQAELAALRDSLSQLPRDTPQTAAAPKTLQPAAPRDSQPDPSPELAALQQQIKRLQDSLAQAPAPTQAAASPAPTGTDEPEDEAYQALQRDINDLQRQVAQQNQVNSRGDEAGDRQQRAELEAELRRLDRRLRQNERNDEFQSAAESRSQQARIAALEAELAALKAGQAVEPDTVVDTVRVAQSPAPDSTALDSAVRVDSTQQPLRAPAADSLAADANAVEFAYQPVGTDTAATDSAAQPESLARDTAEVVTRDTVKVVERDTVVQTQRELLMGTSRVSVFFAKGASQLFESDYAVLDRLVEDLKRVPDLKATVKGYADRSGSAAINERLSRQRAETVADYLMRGGIDESRIEIEYFGENNPRYGEGSLDRRVEVELVADE